MFLVQYSLAGKWITLAKRKSFDAAKAKARAELRAMKGARMTAVIRDGDPDILRRTAENNFGL